MAERIRPIRLLLIGVVGFLGASAVAAISLLIAEGHAYDCTDFIVRSCSYPLWAEILRMISGLGFFLMFASLVTVVIGLIQWLIWLARRQES